MRTILFVGKRLALAGALLIACLALVPGSPVSAALLNSDNSGATGGLLPAQTSSTSAANPASTTSILQSPGLVILQDSTTTFTPKQQARADRLNTQYQRLRGDTYGLRFLFLKATAYRRSYLTFLYGEQFHKRDTTILQNALDNFDTYLQNAEDDQHTSLVDLGYPNGFDASGKNVVNIDTVDSEIHAGLPDFLSSRFEVAKAIFELHSALNLYSQQTGLATPSVPKLRLSPYCLACATSQ